MAASSAPRLTVYLEAPEIGGVTQVIQTLLVRLKETFATSVICRNSAAMRKWRSSTALVELPVRDSALRNREDLLGWFDLVNIFRNIREVRKTGILHCHLHTPFSCMPVIITAGILTRARIITTEHYITQLKYLRRRPLSPLKTLIREARIRFQLFMKRLSFRFIHTIVTVSESNRDFMISQFGGQIEPKLRAIPNGIDLTEYLEPTYTQAGVGDGRDSVLTVVTVAGLNNQKGHEYLLRAVPSVIAEVPRVRFMLVGDGHLRSSLEEMAISLGIENKVEFAGWRTDVPAVLGGSDLFVLPSLFEGLPLSLIEAMASGKAVVATDVDGTHDVVIDGTTGFLVPAQNSEALARRIIDVLRDSQLREKFGLAGRQRALSYFSSERMVRKYSELYRSVLAR